jgi:TolA-binding protein
MTCQSIVESGTMEAYLAGRLSDSEREAFEQHYFSCDRCFEELQVMQAARAALVAHGPEPGAIPFRPVKKRSMLWTGVGIAAAILLASVLWLRPDRPAAGTSQPVAQAPAAAGPDLQLLARIDPPAYVPQTLRGAEGAPSAVFQQAMASYTAGNYADGVRGLRAVLDREPGSLDARYFLSICQLLTGDLESGAAGLQAVIAAGSASPYGEEAHFYLGKAFLKQGKLSAARAELETVAGQRGDLRQKARDILNFLPPQ